MKLKERVEALEILLELAEGAVLRGENLNCEVMRDTSPSGIGFHGKYAETQKDINRLARLFWAAVDKYRKSKK